MEKEIDARLERRKYDWTPWPVYWTAVWVGALVTLGVALIIGLAATALGAHLLGPWPQQVDDWTTVGRGALIVTILGAFFSFVAGGWAAGQVAGIRRSEPAMLHGGIVWLVCVPMLIVFATLGAGGFFGGWYGGLAGTPAWVERTETQLSPNATEEERAEAAAEKERAAKVARNSALGAITALLLGLVGSVLGGWMASGEPMKFKFNLLDRESEEKEEKKSGRQKAKV